MQGAYSLGVRRERVATIGIMLDLAISCSLAVLIRAEACDVLGGLLLAAPSHSAQANKTDTDERE